MASVGHTANAYTSYRNIAVRLCHCIICHQFVEGTTSALSGLAPPL